jgi:uncharacterized membrane protein YhhN
MKKTIFLSILYFLTGFLFIILQGNTSFISGLIIKSLIIPVLMILFVANLKLRQERLHGMILAGLFFSWAGDVALELSGKNGDLFVAGLICFLLAHIMYLTVFFLTPGKNVIFHTRIYLLIPLAIYCVIFMWYLYDDLADMRLPVLSYSAVIIAMLAGAINRLEKVKRESYYMVLTGAILFVISDSAIAVNKFSYNFPSSDTVIMSTYVLAQFLIITGYIKQFREKTE